jgi:hypothetical protein
MMIFSWLKVENKGARMRRSKGIFEIRAEVALIRAGHGALEISGQGVLGARVASEPAF